MPKLSIITINLNNLPGLQKTMQSVLEQKFTDYEYIIIDGGSTDGSKEYIAQHSNKLAYWVSEMDKGIYNALNKGIAHTNGKYCMFLNSGDFLLNEEVLKDSFEIILQQEADIYYGDILLEFENGEQTIQQHAPVLDLNFLEKRTLNHQASFIKRILFDELGNYNEKYGLVADYAFYLNAFLKGKDFWYINKVMVHYKRDGISSRQMELYMQQMKQVWKEMVPLPVEKLLHENKLLQENDRRIFIRLGKKMDNFYQRIKGGKS